MEDPKRMRTKLRLDLADVRRQIEDLEELLKQDKSPENVEAHSKLVEYEKKLKEQYESIAGLSIDQATKLETKEKIAVAKNSPLSAIIGLIGGLLIAWGYYNTILHSLGNFSLFSIVDYFAGNNPSAGGLDTFMRSLLYGSSTMLVTIPILAGSVLVLVAGLLDRTRRKIHGLLEGIAFIITTAYLSIALLLSSNPTTAGNFIVDYMLYYAVLVIFSGILLMITAIGQRTGFMTLLSLIAGIFFAYSGAQFLLLTQEDNIGNEMVYQWPWIALPLVLASAAIGIAHFLKIIKT